ncbi:solute carrier family 29 (equilibrative nucleoside transporter), member 1/2/3 [Mytilus galloprovincialis]|uniref:Solute carrier family 29 (Equilibrative nucleoside transporter), member 1/2/3 n=1 Tax=Mytilus galloprovincialis TaxID=29158 RepID=A0A8B6CCN7_MYTGA|nr:solute carrier family 29 (equilibrative nucleoside transporter), member 1/2/3 [Mytilus galloprovincialis]
MACSSVLTTSLFELAGVLPHRYMQVSMSGQAAGGIFAAVANIVTIAVGTNVSESAFIFFLIATGWTLITLLGYLSLYSKIWVEGISVCLVFLVTLACFPALASSIQ